MESFNNTFFLWANASADTPAWQLTLAAWIAQYLIFVVPLILLALLARPANRRVVIKTVLALLCGIALAKLLNVGWPHPRPFVVGIGHTFLAHQADPSFPSNHGTFIFTFALAMLFWYRRWLGGILLCAGVAIAWSRVYLGVHFPLDMLGALLVAAASCGLVQAGWRQWERHRERSQGRDIRSATTRKNPKTLS